MKLTSKALKDLIMEELRKLNLRAVNQNHPQAKNLSNLPKSWI